MQVVRGIVTCICCLLIARPVAHIYSEPALLWALPVVSLTAVIRGFNSTSLFTLQRQLTIKKITVLELVVQIIGLIVIVILAWINPSLWAPISGSLVSHLLMMIGSHYLMPNYINRFSWSKEVIAAIFSVGKWIIIASGMDFIAAQSDRMIMGKLLSLQALGFYAIAITFAEIPKQIMEKLSERVIFPLMTQQKEMSRGDLRNKILEKKMEIAGGFKCVDCLDGSFWGLPNTNFI